MTRVRIVIGVGVMVLLMIAASVSIFAVAPGTTPEENLQYRIERLQERVDAGIITQEQADLIAAAMTANFADCDGTGARTGRAMGLCLGQSGGRGQGNGVCNGTGSGMRQGQ